MNILEAIGNTSIVRLGKIVPPGCADVLVKLEWENPTGSMKDRMARAVIARAEEDGRLRPGDTVVEYTGGSTGAALALVCAAKGHRLQIRSQRRVTGISVEPLWVTMFPNPPDPGEAPTAVKAIFPMMTPPERTPSKSYGTAKLLPLLFGTLKATLPPFTATG